MKYDVIHQCSPHLSFFLTPMLSALCFLAVLSEASLVVMVTPRVKAVLLVSMVTRRGGDATVLSTGLSPCVWECVLGIGLHYWWSPSCSTDEDGDCVNECLMLCVRQSSFGTLPCHARQFDWVMECLDVSRNRSRDRLFQLGHIRVNVNLMQSILFGICFFHFFLIFLVFKHFEW